MKVTEIEIAASKRHEADERKRAFANKIIDGLKNALKPFENEPMNQQTADRIKWIATNFFKEAEQRGELPRADMPKVALITHREFPKTAILVDEADILMLCKQGLIPSVYKVWT